MDENTIFKGNLRAFPQQIAVQSIAEDQEALAGNFWADVWAGSPIAKEKSQVKSITWLLYLAESVASGSRLDWVSLQYLYVLCLGGSCHASSFSMQSARSTST